MTRIVTADDVRDAVQDTLTTYLPNVLDDVGDLAMPVSHEAPTAEAASIDAAELPVLVVSVAGMTDAPSRDEYGVYTGSFSCLVDFLLRSVEGTYGATARDVRRYAAAIRTVLVERPSLDGFALDVMVTGESYNDADPRTSRTIAQGEVACTVTVHDINRTGTYFTDPTTTGPVIVTETAVTVDLLETP